MKYTEDTGTVISAGDGQSTIRLDHKSSADCGSCCACSAFSGGPPVIQVKQDEFEEGERVTVRIPRPNPFLSIIFVFLLPPALLVAGVLTGQAFQGDERLGAAAAAGGIIGLAVALILAWTANRWFTTDEGPRAYSSGSRYPEGS